MSAPQQTYRVHAALKGAELELPCTNEARALRWMSDLAAVNPGVTVTVFGPEGAIARETAPVRQ